MLHTYVLHAYYVASLRIYHQEYKIEMAENHMLNYSIS